MDRLLGGAAVIGGMAELFAYLADIQSRQETDVRCELTVSLSARVNDAALVEALITGLPMAQGISHRILRSRGRGAVITAKIRYRQGGRMLAGAGLTQQEAECLEIARNIAAQVSQSDSEEVRFQTVYGWVCRNIRYVNTFPGKKGYDQLVGAAGALKDRQANCQGFADVMYLLCGLCGIECEYRCGRGQRRLHVWNAVCLNGVWQEVDASKGARRLLRQQD